MKDKLIITMQSEHNTEKTSCGFDFSSELNKETFTAKYVYDTLRGLSLAVTRTLQKKHIIKDQDLVQI